MAKEAKKIKTKNGLRLKTVNPDAAGTDVSSREMQVCVPLDRDADYSRKFGVFTEDLDALCAWLKSCGITAVAMESTGIYRIPLYIKLQETGFEVYLVNARSVKNFTEEKTDEADAESLMVMHGYGLLKASCQVNQYAREIRSLSRHRENPIRMPAVEVQHMQKYMELMNIKLTGVISDITGKPGQDITGAILKGERDAVRLSSLAGWRCKNPKEVTVKSLEGRWNEDLLFALRQSCDPYEFLRKQIGACEKKMEGLLEKYGCLLESKVNPEAKTKADTDPVEVLRSKKRVDKKTKVAFDVEQHGCQLFGVNLMRIPGISEGSLLKLIGEPGHDFTGKFETCRQFCRRENLAPDNRISGGKIISSRLPKRKNPVGQIFREAANGVKASKTPSGIHK
jgi:transposase